MLFAETGLSAAEISSLFVIWSLTGFLLELPSGMWADVFSRRRLMILAPLLPSAGFALWTFLPSYPSFALGFVLWGAGSALRSGTLQALVYEELTRLGAGEAYPRLIGRAEAFSSTGQLLATAVAAPVLAAGGYRALGIASVAATLLAAAVARTLPESRDPADKGENFAEVFREGLAEVRRAPSVRRSLIFVSVLMGVSAIDEYVPLLAQSTGVGPAVVPMLVLLVTAGTTVGGLLAGRRTGTLAPLLAMGGCCLAAGTLSGHPAGMVLVAVAFGVFWWAIAAADARLQDQITDRSRATITSMSGFGTEIVGVLTFASYALGSVWAAPGPIFALAAIPYLLLALWLWRTR